MRQLVVSDGRECWIQWDRPRSEQDNEWFRVNLGKGTVMRTRLPDGFSMLAATEDRVYGFVRDEYDVPIVTVWRVRE